MDFHCVDCGKIFITREELLAHRQAPCRTVESFSAKLKQGEKSCVICGAPFKAVGRSKTCSSKCAIALQKQRSRESYDRGKKKIKEHQVSPAMVVRTSLGAVMAQVPANKTQSVVPKELQDSFLDEAHVDAMVRVSCIALCKSCMIVYDANEQVKFCPECGTKLDYPKIHKKIRVIS